MIRQRWTDRTESGASRSLIVAVDASKGVKRHVPELVAGLRELAREYRLEILLAADEPEWLGDDPAVLERVSFQGGHENHSALELAIARMRERQAQAEVPALLWIHAPRPVVLKGTYTLDDALRKIRGPLFHFALEPGPNRLWSELEQGVAAGAVPLARLHGVARAGGVADDLRAFGEALRSGAADRVALRERGQPSARGTESLREGTSRAAVHLTRLWAWEESRRLAGHPARDEAAASVLAARYELVTPWSGAVVLETDDEYGAASIPIPRRDSDDPTLGTASLDEPRSEASSEEQLAAASRTQPAIPEPSGALLFAVGCAVLCLCRRKSSRTYSPT